MSSGARVVTNVERAVAYPTALGRFTTREIRQGTGAPVLLLHGASSRADRWVSCMPLLAEAGYEAIAVDLPGHGFADKPAEFSYTGPAMAELVIDWLTRNGPAVVVGTSLGGFVGAITALERPDLIKALILVGVTGIVPRDTSTSQVIGDRSPEGVRRKLRKLLVDPSPVDDRWVLEESLINSSPGAAVALDKVMSYLTDGIATDLVGARLAEVICPVMVIWGEQDAWIPLEIGDQVASLVPQAPYVVMRRCGHAPYLERPRDFVSLVVDFLDPDQRRPAGRQHI